VSGPRGEADRAEVVVYTDAALDDAQTSRLAHPLDAVAVGFLVYEDAGSITLASELIGTSEYRGQIAIPKVAIVSREVVARRGTDGDGDATG
jgi:hypothetical protein